VRHRAALEAGADPEMVAEWTRDVRRRRDAAEAALRGRPQSPVPLTGAQVADAVESLGGLCVSWPTQPREDKCDLYRELGVSMTYQYQDRTVLVEATPRSTVDLMVVSEGGVAHQPHASR
jgi:hypothetical protein